MKDTTNRIVREETGFRLRTWYRLTGLFSRQLPKGIIKYSDCDISVEKPWVTVSVYNSQVKYSMRCNLDTKIIHVSLCELTTRQKGTATAILKYKFNIAGSMHFTKITCVASAENRNQEKDRGYFVWGKLGFTMRYKKERDKFKERDFFVNGNRCQYLHELLETCEGEKTWYENGFTWHGLFRLKKQRINKILFWNYIRRRATRV